MTRDAVQAETVPPAPTKSADGHTYEEVENQEGLSYCPTCGGGEGSLPTECPGTRMHGRVEERVYAGALDYVNGRWVQLELRGLVIRMPERYFSRPELRAREGHSLSRASCPLNAVYRWGNTAEEQVLMLLGVEVPDGTW